MPEPAAVEAAHRASVAAIVAWGLVVLQTVVVAEPKKDLRLAFGSAGVLGD